jgi:hypothetical protein
VEVWSFLGAACGVAGDPLLELSVLGRLSVTDFVVILRVVVAHNLLILGEQTARRKIYSLDAE